MRHLRKDQGNSPMFSMLPGLLVLLFFMVLPGALSAQYLGAEACVDCHATQYEDWIASGHRMILMSGENAQHRALPLPDGKVWGDISYVVGGHKTKAIFLDDQGFLMEEQYELLTGDWTAAHDGGMVPYDCAMCHSTGYDAAGNQDGLPGFVGTFQLPGVQCEHCHGAGMAMTPGPTDAAFCGECHSHAEAGTVAAADGFILSEGQYNEFMASPHSGSERGCVGCHNPHKTAQFGVTAQCADCHSGEAAAYAGTTMEAAGVICEDCHMAPATLSASPLGQLQGDMKSHIFKINPDAAADMFTQGGSQLALTDGKGAVTLDFACQRCHMTASLDELSKFALDFHNPAAAFQNVGINTGLTGTWWDATRSGEGYLLEVTMLNGAPFMFLSFYTYDNMGNQVFLVATTNAVNGTTAELDVFITSGQFWGDGWVPGFVAESEWGTGTIDFASCGEATVSLRPNSAAQEAGFTNYIFNLTRLFENIACPAFDSNSGVAAN